MIIKQNEFESCDCNIIHEDVVNKARESMYHDDTYLELAEFFKMFANATRAKILNALMISEMCVCDIAALLGMNQSAVSHQLRVLKQSRLVKYRKYGKIVYYSLDDDHIKQIFDLGLTHLGEM